MAELKERLRADLNDAMRARDQVRMRTLRMALSSITNEEVAGTSARDLSDEEVVKVLTREANTETGASGMQGMGQVMKTLTPKVAGRADGARVAAEVRRRLSSS